jgi:hypothetical protein
LKDALLARVVATAAWITAALAILGLLSPTVAALDSLAINIGNVRLSVLLGIKVALVVAILLWAALALARLIRVRIQYVAGLSPSVQVLAGNLIKIALVSVALLIGLNIVGIDLTALTVFSGGRRRGCRLRPAERIEFHQRHHSAALAIDKAGRRDRGRQHVRARSPILVYVMSRCAVVTGKNT